MKGAEFIRKYRYILLLAGTAIAFVFGFGITLGIVSAFDMATAQGEANASLTVGGLTGMVGFVCICLAELRRI